MTRNKNPEKPSAIITADIHLTTRIPVSRTDDYLQAQLDKIEFLRKLQHTYKCPIDRKSVV